MVSVGGENWMPVYESYSEFNFEKQQSSMKNNDSQEKKVYI